jgi:putative exosortase-associated protein (TIGR04073 family)
MRLQPKKILTVVLATVFFWGIGPASLFAESGVDYSVEISQKFGRGIGNVLSSPLEIPCGIRDEVRERGAAGIGTGLFKGLALFARRVLVGVTEVGTFMIPMEATIPSVCAEKPKARLERSV